MLWNGRGELLLIRNSYGHRDVWVLPGGGIGRRESPKEAAVREIREELGIAIADLELVASYKSSSEGKRDTVHLFTATALGSPAADSIEVEEARFFARDALPNNVSPATVRRIHEIRCEQPIDDRW
jgi:ADP-ribose pyrophosphatase YjhB (NUDIX family)